tara:strand:+ start:279 stop:749 length:471 start_codon:yes stop_codon:yes gene_type:complete
MKELKDKLKEFNINLPKKYIKSVIFKLTHDFDQTKNTFSNFKETHNYFLENTDLLAFFFHGKFYAKKHEPVVSTVDLQINKNVLDKIKVEQNKLKQADDELLKKAVRIKLKDNIDRWNAHSEKLDKEIKFWKKKAMEKMSTSELDKVFEEIDNIRS